MIRTRVLTAILALTATVTAVTGRPQTPIDSSRVSGVEAHVTPALASPGTTVTIDGRSVIDKATRLVRITVTPPDGTPASLTVKAGENGDFTPS
jgi:hypothetical protein